MKTMKKYLLLLMVFAAMACITGCSCTRMEEEETTITDDVRDNETENFDREDRTERVTEDVTVENDGIMDEDMNESATNHNDGVVDDVIDDIEDGVEDVGDDVSRALDGNGR